MPRTSLLVPLVIALGLSITSTAAATEAPGEEVCVTSAVEGARGRLCAQRDGFGAVWTAELTDTDDDGRRVKARVGLDVEAGRDPSAELESDIDGAVVRESGRLSARIGSSLRSVSLETCVDVRFGRDRCEVASVTLPQLPAGGEQP